jgi:hypothetical protein
VTSSSRPARPAAWRPAEDRRPAGARRAFPRPFHRRGDRPRRAAYADHLSGLRRPAHAGPDAAAGGPASRTGAAAGRGHGASGRGVLLPALPADPLCGPAGGSGSRGTAGAGTDGVGGLSQGDVPRLILHVRKRLRDVFKVTISRGQLVKVINKAAGAMAGAYAQLRALLPAEAYLNVDETGHKAHGQPW